MALEALLDRHHGRQLAQTGCSGSVHQNLSYLSRRSSRVRTLGAEMKDDLDAEMEASIPNMVDSMSLAQPPFDNVSNILRFD
jgi:hypothetical protein